MLIEAFKKDGYKSIELRSGCNGSGKKIFSVQSVRNGEAGKILHIEKFSSENEARSWVRWSL